MLYIDFDEIIAEVVRQVIKLEGKDQDDDEYVEGILKKIYSDQEFVESIARSIAMHGPFTNFKRYEMAEQENKFR